MILKAPKDKLVAIFMLTFTLYFLLLWISPVVVNIGISLTALLIFFTSVFLIPPSVLLGIRFTNLIPKRRLNTCSRSLVSYSKNLAFTLVRLNWCAAFGLFLVIVDRFVIRGVPLGLDMFDARNMLDSTDTSAFGLVGQILSSVIIFSVGYLLIEKRSRLVSRFKTVTTYALATIYLLLSASLGSRSGLLNFFLITSFMLLLHSYLSNPKYKPPLTVFIKMFFFAIILVLVMSAMFLWRLAEMEMDIFSSIMSSGFAYTISPTDGILALTRDGIFGDLFLATISLVQYVIHGFYEFQLLVENFDGDHTYGQQVLWFPLKIFNVLGGSIYIADLDNVQGVRNGIFTSFFGPVFIDFGIFTPLATACIFFVLSIPVGWLSHTRLWTLAYAALMCSLIVCLPIWNSILSAAWMYPLASALMMPLITLRFKNAQFPGRRYEC